jgi:hypothetical protein
VFLDFDPAANGFALVVGSPDVGNREACRMSLLPSGRGLVSLSTGIWCELEFTAGGDRSWAPTAAVQRIPFQRNTTVAVFGQQLCGLSECQSYGDDNQQAEHYPMVRVKPGSPRSSDARESSYSAPSAPLPNESRFRPSK